MSFRYRKYRSYTKSSSWNYKPKFFFSEKELDFTSEILDYNQFLLQEFFNSDKDTKRKLAKYYVDKFGMRAYSYLDRKYSEWANGDYHITDMMQDRILSFMPKFLSKDAKHKLGIHEFMASIKHIVKIHERDQNYLYNSYKTITNSDDLFNIFQCEYEKIKKITSYKFKFNVLSDDEKTEAIEIGKYILEIKLQSVFEQIESDFNIFLPYIERLNMGVVKANYKIHKFKVQIELSKVKDIEIPRLDIKDSDTNSRFKYYAEKYLAFELLGLRKHNESALKDSILSRSDLDMFENHMNKVILGDIEVSLSSIFHGKAGELNLFLSFIPKRLLYNSILKSIFKIVSYGLIVIFLLSLSLFENIESIFVIVGFIFGLSLLGIIKFEFDTLNNFIAQLKQNGKSSTTR
jgi:hypothetical protein